VKSVSSIIYVVIPRNIITGGTQSLHQIAYELSKLHPNVYIHYKDSDELTQPKKFEKYRVPVAREIIDNENNVLIFSETNTEYVSYYRSIRKCIWWLSLDYYLRQFPQNAPRYFCERHNIPLFLEPLIAMLLKLSGRLANNIYRFSDPNVFHLYNCEYVREYLVKQGVQEDQMLYLCGPISDEYFDVKVENKENIIAYNPAKGLKYTLKLIEEVKKRKIDIEFVPIKNLDNRGVIDLLSRAKLYVDFGYFPGPERIPREAVMLKAIIITSLYGSARNDIDVPIPKEYKFDLDNFDHHVESILSLIQSIMNDYESHVPFFDKYREKVIEQKVIFSENIKKFYRKIIENTNYYKVTIKR
jgi:hypothetical protein